MEAAMEIAASDAEGGSSPTPAEMSPECRKELEESAKRVAASRGHSAKASSGSSSSTGEGASAASQRGKTDSSDAANNSAQSTIVLVVSLLALFGAVVGYIIYINANMSQGGTKKSMRKKVCSMGLLWIIHVYCFFL
jgi:cobalamin biosynthesis Mg chelatase CobN